ncbi:MAG: hypothetical protein H6566_11985 [Lewinellaceae bacterium]|nr:hypothetical protein [Lewinellaceae bacterium]
MKKGKPEPYRVSGGAPYPKHLWVESPHKDFPAFSRPAGTGQVWPFFALQIDGGDSRAPLKTTKWQRVKKGEKFPQSEAEKGNTQGPRGNS